MPRSPSYGNGSGGVAQMGVSPPIPTPRGAGGPSEPAYSWVEYYPFTNPPPNPSAHWNFSSDGNSDGNITYVDVGGELVYDAFLDVRNTPAGGDFRAEYSFKGTTVDPATTEARRFKIGSEVACQFDLFVPTDYGLDGNSSTQFADNKPELISQFHSTPGVPMALWVNNLSGQTSDELYVNNQGPGQTFTALGRYMSDYTGTWVTIRWEIKWAQDSTGYWKIFFDHEATPTGQVLNVQTVPSGETDPNPWWKIGIYKWRWRADGSPDIGLVEYRHIRIRRPKAALLVAG